MKIWIGLSDTSEVDDTLSRQPPLSPDNNTKITMAEFNKMVKSVGRQIIMDPMYKPHRNVVVMQLSTLGAFNINNSVRFIILFDGHFFRSRAEVSRWDDAEGTLFNYGRPFPPTKGGLRGALRSFLSMSHHNITAVGLNAEVDYLIEKLGL